jgi:hypothetical protein
MATEQTEQKWQTLGDWAKRHGLTYQAAWRQWQRGLLPVQARQLSSGMIIVRVDEDDKDESEWQRLVVWAKRHGLTYRAAWRQWRQGQLPVQARQLPTGTIVVRVNKDDGDESEGNPSWQKLSVWAKRQGLTYRAAWRRWRRGRLPVQARQLPTGTIVVRVDENHDVPPASQRE